jgi:branched-subunit amino acid aminotransferase/4-amino-4-deoxychorismate lyase
VTFLRGLWIMRIIGFDNYLAVLDGARQPWHGKYYAFYSSLLGGVTFDPVLMQVPIDDHLVHRGDGVFDTFKCVGRAAYNLDAHLRRLVKSAAAIGLAWPEGLDDIRRLTLETLDEAGQERCTGRVMLARGPGSFGVSPYESPAPALYIVVYAAGTPFMEKHPAGARVRRSLIPAKPARFATVKNCNYLPNVMMKREAVDWGVDFVVGFDDNGVMTEGATENFGIVTSDGELLFPRMDAVLEGTTMMRVVQLARRLFESGELSAIGFRDITENEVRAAKEMLVVGTTINVASVCEFEGAPVGDGEPGVVGKTLDGLLMADIASNRELRTTY